MRKQAGQKRRNLRAFHELRRTGQQAEHHAHQRRVREIARRDVHQQFRSAPKVTSDERRVTRGNRFPCHTTHVTRHTNGVAQFLRQQHVKFFRCELVEKIVEALLQGCRGKTRARSIALLEFTLERV